MKRFCIRFTEDQHSCSASWSFVLLSALVSGIGINLTTDAFSITNWLTSAGSWVFVAGTLVLGVGLAPTFFGIKALRMKGLILTILGVAISIGAYYLYSPSLVTSAIAIPSILTILAAILFLSDKTAKIVMNKAVFISLLTIVIFSLQFLIYPSALGHTLSIDSVTTSGAVGTQYEVESADRRRAARNNAGFLLVHRKPSKQFDKANSRGHKRRAQSQ